jgi:aspartyl-tRNA(Asn)/glutamyl-tRNA(Gln) amidotransferase subunit A
MTNMLSFATIKDLRQFLARKELSKSELLSFFVQQFARYDATLGSALEIFEPDSILQQHTHSGLLDGIPGLIKDNIAQAGRRLTCASKILESYRAPYNATVIDHLQKQGALCIGRANMDEFAMGSSNETSAYKKAKNPWDLSRVPGGSSGGSAAAVAAGLIPWSLGSETGGSIRQPAALCGIVGMKPTYGLVSRYGLVAYASSLDQIGPMTRTVYDNALVLSVLAGHDTHDATSLKVTTPDYVASLTGKIKKGLRIGVVDGMIDAPSIHPEIRAALEKAILLLEELGAVVTRVQLPALEYSAATYFIISRAEAASNLARFDGVRYGQRAKADTLSQMYQQTRHDGFGPEVRTRILVGNYVLSAGYAGDFYENAQKVQRLLHRQFNEAFARVDLICMPTHPTPAFPIGAFDLDKLQMDLQDYFTCGANLAGIPAIALPCGMTTSQLPIGMQLVGPRLSESLLYQTAYAYEQATQWHTMHPTEFQH